MPTAPLRTCPGSPRCRHGVQKGPCADCAKTSEQRRGSRPERGGEAAWDRLRAECMCDPANKYCVRCAANGRQELATECELDRGNLQPLCGVCQRRTAAPQQLPEVVWNGAMDRAGTCPSLVDGSIPRPSTLNPANLTDIAEPHEQSTVARAARLSVSV